MKLRAMTPGELVRALDWAADEGWNPGREDAEAFFAADPQGFFVAEVDNAPVAAISVVNHTDDFAFLGLYLCQPEHRGKGIGYALWQHGLAHAGDRTVGLDGVPAQQENYHRSGFVLAGENTRFAGALPRAHGPRLRAVSGADIAHLIELEAIANGVPKPRFLHAWFQPTHSRRTLCLGAEENPSAFLTVRRCVTDFKIGPLIAPGPDEARDLLTGAAHLTEDAPVMIDVPGDQVELAALCREMGMEPCFSTARMYRGPAPVSGPGLRALTTLELG